MRCILFNCPPILDAKIGSKEPKNRLKLIPLTVSKLFRVQRLFFLFFPLIAWGATTDGSILLHNDTTMILTAVIQASDGTFLGQFSVQPGQQKNFTTNMSPTNYQRPGVSNVSITPYNVIWQCPSEGIFSMCTGVSPGAYVKATVCEGAHFCAPKKKTEKQLPASRLQKVK